MAEDNKVNNGEKTVSIKMLARCVLVLGLALIVFLSINLYAVVSSYRDLAEDFSLHMHSHDVMAKLQNGSDDMTEKSQLFAVTHNPDSMQQYFSIVDKNIREDAYEKMVSHFSNKGYDEAIKNMRSALSKSNELMDYEIHSMKLIVEAVGVSENRIPSAVKAYALTAEEVGMSPAQKIERARYLVFGNQYQQRRDKIDADVTEASAGMSDKLEYAMDVGMKHVGRLIVCIAVLCVLLSLLFIVVFILNNFLVIRPIQFYTQSIQENRRFEPIGARELKYLATTYNDIFEISQMNKQHTDYLLEHDALTNANSRLAFEELKKVLTHTKTPIALLILDVDAFKDVNDHYGHEVGDNALIKIVKVLRSLLRGDDIVARIGGDEFVVVMMNVRADSTNVIGEKLDRLNQILQNPTDGTPALSLSIGMAFSEEGYGEELFRQADYALYEAKSHGKSCYKVYEAGN